MNMVEYALVPISTHCLGHTLPIINTAIPLYGHLVKLQPVLLCGHPVVLQPIIHTYPSLPLYRHPIKLQLVIHAVVPVYTSSSI